MAKGRESTFRAFKNWGAKIGMGHMMGLLEIDERGRLTIPKEEREKLGLYPGKKVTISIKQGELVVRPCITPEDFIKELRGCVRLLASDSEALKIKEIWEKQLD
ncbi:MAG TPA: AbrB/MazE/SpoVT family DNA-binding domain-containing protein [Candidatus Hodarchaeales archaeon]|nr:AbrB/MazE/SpoVT family DNA-binding domain-containing protein [Candidatus Hodarchaeales archaeon]